MAAGCPKNAATSALGGVTSAVNEALPTGLDRFTTDRLVTSVKFLIVEGLAEKELLGRAPRQREVKGVMARQRASEVAAALVAGRPKITLEQLGVELNRMGHKSPRGGGVWAPSSVKVLLDRARANGLLA
jgi:hypothetical protein